MTHDVVEPCGGLAAQGTAAGPGSGNQLFGGRASGEGVGCSLQSEGRWSPLGLDVGLGPTLERRLLPAPSTHRKAASFRGSGLRKELRRRKPLTRKPELEGGRGEGAHKTCCALTHNADFLCEGAPIVPRRGPESVPYSEENRKGSTRNWVQGQAVVLLPWSQRKGAAEAGGRGESQPGRG